MCENMVGCLPSNIIEVCQHLQTIKSGRCGSLLALPHSFGDNYMVPSLKIPNNQGFIPVIWIAKQWYPLSHRCSMERQLRDGKADCCCWFYPLVSELLVDSCCEKEHLFPLEFLILVTSTFQWGIPRKASNFHIKKLRPWEIFAMTRSLRKSPLCCHWRHRDLWRQWWGWRLHSSDIESRWKNHEGTQWSSDPSVVFWKCFMCFCPFGPKPDLTGVTVLFRDSAYLEPIPWMPCLNASLTTMEINGNQKLQPWEHFFSPVFRVPCLVSWITQPHTIIPSLPQVLASPTESTASELVWTPNPFEWSLK